MWRSSLTAVVLATLIASCEEDGGSGLGDGVVPDLPDSGPPGDSATLDSTFGTGGLMVFQVPGASEVPGMGGVVDVLAVGPEIIVAVNPRFGEGGNPPMKGTLVRIELDGTIDPGFGTDGFAVLDPGSPWFILEEVARDGAGRLVAVGSMSSGGSSFTGAARTDGDGRLDTGFAEGGFFMDTYGDESLHQSKGFAMTLLGTGILIGGRYDQPTRPGNAQWGLTKLTDSGALDPTFGGGGHLLIDIRSDMGSQAGAIRELYACPGGGFVAAGAFINFDVNDGQKRALLAAMDDDGGFDPAFGEDGRADVDTFEGSTQSLGVQSAGDYVLWTESNALQRFSPTGTQDVAFGEAGVATLPRAASVIQVGPDDRIYAAGTDRTGSTPPVKAQVVRLGPDGAEDREFGAATVGLSTVGDTGKLFPSAIEFLADGRIVVAGSYEDTDGGGRGFFVARFWP